jgi:hypothetical protein
VLFAARKDAFVVGSIKRCEGRAVENVESERLACVEETGVGGDVKSTGSNTGGRAGKRTLGD